MKKNKQTKGLGDTIENVLNSKPVKPLTEIAKKILFKDGEDCGCNERKAKLNKLFNYKRKALRCLNEEEVKAYKKYVKRRKLNEWKEEDKHLLINLYAKVFAIQYNINNFCVNCEGSGQILLKMSGDLDKVYKSYK